MRKILFITLSIFLTGSVLSQSVEIPDVPVIDGYKGEEGRISKYNFFNYMMLKDELGQNQRQSTGEYWEVNYSYDSAFRQKEKFAEFIESQIKENGGTRFFKDTSSIHFAIPGQQGNLWGKVLLNSNSYYKLKLIREKPFENRVEFDGDQDVKFDEYVQPVEMPPRIGFFPNSVVTRAEQSKFNHYSFTYTDKNKKAFRQNLMGPYWDFKIEVQDETGEVDKRVSYVEIQESYYRAALKAGGNIVKNRARETIFSLPGEEFTTWIRIMLTMDGVYFVKLIKQFPEDYIEPELLYDNQQRDSLPSH